MPQRDAQVRIADGARRLDVVLDLDELAGVAGRAGVVLTAALAVQGVSALRALAVQMVATGAAASVLSADIAKIPKIVNIAVAVTGFEVGFQIGDFLREVIADLFSPELAERFPLMRRPAPPEKGGPRRAAEGPVERPEVVEEPGVAVPVKLKQATHGSQVVA